MAGFDPAYANSSGYFKDPGTGEDLSVDIPRSVACELRDGKFIWPQVTVSTGEKVKIVYKYFTDEEKQLYKEYRGRGSGSSTSRPAKKKGTPHLDPATGEVVYDEPEVSTPAPKPVRVKQEYNDPANAEVEFVEEGSESSPATQELIASCDHVLGCSYIAGITYALLTKDSNPYKIYHVPRALIKEEDMRRLS